MNNRKLFALLLALCLTAGGCAAQPGQTTQPPQTTAPTTEPTTAPTQPTEATEPTEPPTEPTQPPTEPYIPVIYPDVVGIYIPAGDGTKDRTYITAFTYDRKAKQDIDCFEIFASQQERITGSSFKSMWNQVWESHENRENAKIGYHLMFALKDGTAISQTVLKPGDAKAFYEYLEVYLYDDVHQSGWYSHLEDNQMKEDTLITSIKLTCGSKIDQVGTIALTAFIYNGDDNFDADGIYIGTVKQTIFIQSKQAGDFS